jgi:repressor of nif and glnA expression
MPTNEEHILRTLSEADEPLFASEIAERLNRELGAGTAYTATEVVRLLMGLGEAVEHMREGGWTLRRRIVIDK